MTEPLRPDEIDVANTEALEELAWAIEAAQGEFKLILARCNYINLRDRLVQQLQQLCTVPLQTLTLSETAQSLYATIRAELGEEQPAALMVFGLESVRDLEQVLTATNQVREEFRKHFHFPLVLWIHDDVLKKLVRLAPDLESWATVTEFAIAPNTLLQTLRQEIEELFATLFDPASNRAWHSRLEQVSHLVILQPAELESALQDVQQQGQLLDPELRANLELCRGLNASNRIVGLQHFERSLTFWQGQVDATPAPASNNTTSTTFTTPPQLKVGLLLFYIGQYRYVLIAQGREEETNWQSVYETLKKAIEIFERSHWPGLVAACLTRLERTLQKLKAWDELEQVANRAIALQPYYRSPVRFAQNYGFLARATLERQQWKVAKQAALSALEITNKQPENRRWFQGLYLLFLAQAQRATGETSTAIATLLPAKQLGDQGYPKFYIQVLNELRDLYHSQKQYLEAFQVKQLRLSVEQQYGIRAFVGAGRLQPKREAVAEEVGTRQHEQQVAETGEVAPEIIASGRQRDLEALLQRIGRNDCKLIVVHGLSGVGKSSLVAAGLVPALQRRAIGTQENLPVLMRKYTDWIEVLGEELAQALGAIAQQRERATLQGREFLVEPAPSHTLPAILEQLRQNEQDNLRTILIFDQFEEFFFACTEPLQRRQFFEFLGECLHVLSLKVILSLREDYLHYLLECNRLESMKIIEQDILGRKVLYSLGNFTPTAAKAIVQDLSDRAQFYLEPALVDKVVTDLAGELEEVRPIELQIVGAQLQTEAITTLAHYCQRGPKQELVKRYLSEVVEDCGPENYDVAELVLYLLTDEKGTRPLKTRAELERDLQALVTNAKGGAKKLDLVLQIFVESGLVVLLKESPADRYQLVHDYLAAFIRQQQEPKLQALMVELEAERQQRRLGEAKLNKFLKRALIGSVSAGVGLAALATVAVITAQQAEDQRKRADQSAIEALNNSAEAQLALGQPFDAMLVSLKAVDKLQKPQGQANNTQMAATLNLWQALHEIREQNRLEGHTARVLNIQFSPDGKTIASAGYNNTVRLWNLQGQELQVLKGHIGAVFDIQFSPDGKIIASASDDNTVRLWNLQGQQLQVLKGHTNPVWDIQFSPDGKTIASASDDNTVRFWNLQGQQLQVLKGHIGAVFDIQFSPDGKTIASASGDNTVRLWNLQGQELQVLKGHTGAVFDIQFSPDGKTIASASADNTVRLWNLQGQQLQVLGHTGSVSHVQFSPDGKTIASASDDNTVRFWNLQGQQLQVLKGHTDQVWGIQFSPDGKTIASASADNTVRLWNLQGQELQVLKGHTGAVSDIQFSPDGKTIASASADNTVRLWNLQGQQLQVLGHTGSVSHVQFSPDGKTIASASDDNTVRFWNLQGQQLQVLKGHTGSVSNIRFSPDGKTIASTSDDKTVRLWNLQGQELQVLKGHTARVWDIQFSPDGKTIASASWDNTVRLWNLQGQELQVLKGHTGSVLNIQFSPDGKTIASASGDNTVRLWNLQGQELQALKGHTDVSDIQFSPDGKTIASADDNIVRFWNLQGQQLQVLKGHTGFVLNIQFSPDGKTIASASGDKTVRLWNLQGQELQVLKGHTDQVRDIQFSPDGKTIASASDDKTVRLWNLQGQELQVLKGHTDQVRDIQFSPDGKTIASASDDKTVRLWNLNLLDLIEQSCNWLFNYFVNHPEALTEVESCQKSEFKSAAAPALIFQGKELARKDFLNEATTKLKQALEWNPNLELPFKLQPQQFVQRIAQAQQSIDAGEKLAQSGNFAGAIAKFQEAVELDPSLEIKPETKAKQLVADALTQKAQNLAEQENLQGAIAKFQEAVELDPSLEIKPETKAKQLVADALTQKAQNLAEQENLQGAIAELRKLAKLDPSLEIKPEADAKQLVVTALIQKVQNLAEQENLQGAIAESRKLAKLDPSLEIKPEADAKQLVVAALTQKAQALVEQEAYQEAISAYIKVQKLDAQASLSADEWANLCIESSLNNQAQAGLPACEQAVRLSPQESKGDTHGSRGIARALTNNRAGAIEDFEIFIASSDDKEGTVRVEKWILDLRSGKQPFTPEELKKLREE